MGLEIGSRLGHYEVTALIGEGGMGQVYQATDTKLNREVALKILPEAFASDPDRLARFQREAQVLASLNHPGIAAIYGIEEVDDVRALVLELVEGPTLADRIAQGPIPLDEALPVATQIAQALEAPHEQGVIHRDLKPANIKLKPDGTVKVLDFGLAKALDVTPEGDPSKSPTMTAAATQMGVIMGTAAYMSPEQARGKPVDKRADIWAFGAVLYQMLTGTAAFEGEDITLTLAEVVKSDPAWALLPPETPPALVTVLRRCLEKDPRQRLRDIGDVRLAMEGAFDTGTTVGTEATTASAVQFWQRPVPAAVATLLVAAVSGLAVWSLTRPGPQPVTRFEIPLRADQAFSSAGRHVVAVSPDGRRIVHTTREGLSVRSLDQVAPVLLSGTVGAQEPFFSPDGEWIAFFADGQLRKIATSGGVPVTLCEAVFPLGASWGDDDMILYGSQGIWRVSGQGGTPELLIEMDGANGESAHGPQMLPGGDAVLFTLATATGGNWDDANIVVQSLASGERKVLIEGGRDGRYLYTGHLVYGREGALMAAPFDRSRLEVTQGSVPLVEGVEYAATNTGAVQYSVSDEGSLVYVPGSDVGVERPLVWVDRQGREEALPVPALASFARVSPDGTRLALELQDQSRDIWIYELTRGTSTRLTFSPEADRWPLWTPDSRRIVFTSGSDLVWKAADGTGDVETLATGLPSPPRPSAWSGDGMSLVFDRSSGRGDTFLLSLDGDRQPETLIGSEFGNVRPAVSLNGRWIAYQSNESGRFEIYVRPFPDVGSGRWQISTEGGQSPVWSPDGRELFYLSEGAMMVVGIDATTSMSPGTPEVLFEGPYFMGLAGNGRPFDVSPDGRGFVMVKEGDALGEALGPRVINLVQNWTKELLERVPVN